MEDDIVRKIRAIIKKEEQINEDNIRILLILIRKLLDKMDNSDNEKFLILRLFCNWSLHNEITNSNTGLRILANINDTLVKIKNTKNNITIQNLMSQSIGFPKLRKELMLLLSIYDINTYPISKTIVWVEYVRRILEIIRDVPLAFPKLSNLDPTKQKIYNQIAENAIKTGAGVISIKISNYLYPDEVSEKLSLFIKTEDTTTIIIPLLIDVRL